jgi:hypothetical protein
MTVAIVFVFSSKPVSQRRAGRKINLWLKPSSF